MKTNSSTEGADYETCWYYRLFFTVQAGGYNVSCLPYTVHISDANDRPTSPFPSYDFDVYENSRANTLIGTAIPAADEDVYD